MNKRYFTLMILLVGMIGCTADLAEPVAETTPRPIETATMTAPLSTGTAVLTLTPTSSLHNAMTMTRPYPTQTRTPFMTEFAGEEKALVPAGLLFIDPAGQHFLVNSEGVPEPLGEPGDDVSPDGLYKMGRLAATSLATGEQVTFYEGEGFILDWCPPRIHRRSTGIPI